MEETQKRKKRRKYDADFKAEVLKMLAAGQSASHISQRLGIGENLIYRWKQQAKQTQEIPPSESGLSVSALLAQVATLQQQLKKAETERDILKKAVSIFSNSP